MTSSEDTADPDKITADPDKITLNVRYKKMEYIFISIINLLIHFHIPFNLFIFIETQTLKTTTFFVMSTKIQNKSFSSRYKWSSIA